MSNEISEDFIDEEIEEIQQEEKIIKPKRKYVRKIKAKVDEKPIVKKMCQGAHILLADTLENFPESHGGRYSKFYLKMKGLIK